MEIGYIIIGIGFIVMIAMILRARAGSAGNLPPTPPRTSNLEDDPMMPLPRGMTHKR